MKKDMKYWINCEMILQEPNCLIAGMPGSGKSVFLNSIIWSSLSSWNYMWLVDPKRVELRKWKKFPQCKGHATEIEDVVKLLKEFIFEMDRRYRRMEMLGTTMSDETPCYLFIDEMADLMTYKEVEPLLLKIIRLARASNMHLVMCSQSPNRRVITANIQNCITSSVALRCRSSIESRQIIGVAGAESLPLYGYGLFMSHLGLQKIEINQTPESEVEKRYIDWLELTRG